MSFVIYIYLVLKFFIYTIICGMIYIIYKIIAEKRFSIKRKESFNQSIKLINLYLENKDDEIILYIKKRIKRESFFIGFNDAIVVLKKEYNLDSFLKIFKNDIEKKVKKYRDKIKKNYILECIGIYEITTPYIKWTIKKECVYRKNKVNYKAIGAACKGRDAKFILNIIRKINSKKCVLNHKLFVDLILGFNGDMQDLNNRLLENYFLFEATLKKIIIVHFFNTKYEKASKVLGGELGNGNDKEIKISILRYFSKIKYSKVLDNIIRDLKKEDWEYKAVACFTLNNYYNDEVEKILLDFSKDRNWHIRKNAIKVLIKHMGEENLKERLERINDRYTTEMFEYLSIKLEEDVWQKG